LTVNRDAVAVNAVRPVSISTLKTRRPKAAIVIVDHVVDWNSLTVRTSLKDEYPSR